MRRTDRHSLNLPEYTDTVDIEQLNDNFMEIDGALLPPQAGEEGQVLTITDTGAEWADPTGGTKVLVKTWTEDDFPE